jgi:hypothetical protein
MELCFSTVAIGQIRGSIGRVAEARRRLIELLPVRRLARRWVSSLLDDIGRAVLARFSSWKKRLVSSPYDRTGRDA